jgi:hypothetical protein
MCISSKVGTIALSLCITKSSYLSISLVHTHIQFGKMGNGFTNTSNSQTFYYNQEHV